MILGLVFGVLRAGYSRREDFNRTLALLLCLAVLIPRSPEHVALTLV